MDEGQPAAKRSKRARKQPPPPSAAELAAAALLDQAVVAELRVKSSLLLADALRDDTPLADLGLAVEAALDDAHGAGSSAYRCAVRVLVASLRRNERLAGDVRAGRVTAAQLVAAPPRELATEQQEEERRRLESRALLRADRSALEGGQETEAYACPACGGAKASFVRINGVRDGPKCDTWGSKDSADSGGAILLRCSSCRHEWQTSE